MCSTSVDARRKYASLGLADSRPAYWDVQWMVRRPGSRVRRARLPTPRDTAQRPQCSLPTSPTARRNRQMLPGSRAVAEISTEPRHRLGGSTRIAGIPVACRLLRDSESIAQQLTATVSGRFGRPQRLDLRRLRVSRLPSVRCACLLSIGRCARRRCRRAACALGQDASAAASIADGIARARSANGQSVGTRQQRGTTSRTVKGAIEARVPTRADA